MKAISDFEKCVFEWISIRTDDAALQAQLVAIKVVEREHTGVGCYSTLAVPADVPTTTASYRLRGPLGGPNFESPVVEYGGGTLLWFRDGCVECLEIYAHGDYFPADHSELGEFTLLD